MRERGNTRLEILDGDVIRTNLSKGLGFSKEDRETNISRIAVVCRLLTRHDVVAIAAAVSPYRESCDHARREIGRFVEVCGECSREVLIQRDPKGLYRRALAGEMRDGTGVSDPYEEPIHPEITVHTDCESIEESTSSIISALEELQLLSAQA